MSKKAILAFSGGLDTSVAVKYLLQEYGLETITVTVDVLEARVVWRQTLIR